MYSSSWDPSAWVAATPAPPAPSSPPTTAHATGVGRPLAQAVAAMPRAVFVGWTADPPAIVVATSADSGVDAGPVLRSALDAVGGRGGGNARLAQGTAPSAAAVEQVAGALLSSAPR